MRTTALTMVVSALLLVGDACYCFRIIPMGFIPSQDTGQINGQTEMAQGIGFEAMVDAPARGDGDRSRRSEREVGTSSIGVSAATVGGSNGGRCYIELKPRDGTRR